MSKFIIIKSLRKGEKSACSRFGAFFFASFLLLEMTKRQKRSQRYLPFCWSALYFAESAACTACGSGKVFFNLLSLSEERELTTGARHQRNRLQSVTNSRPNLSLPNCTDVTCSTREAGYTVCALSCFAIELCCTQTREALKNEVEEGKVDGSNPCEAGCVQ